MKPLETTSAGQGLTANQRRASELAQAIIDQTISVESMTDDQWALLMLAADVFSIYSSPLLLAHRVGFRLSRRIGYFARQPVPALGCMGVNAESAPLGSG
jgi:hypothetical protein